MEKKVLLTLFFKKKKKKREIFLKKGCLVGKKIYFCKPSKKQKGF